MDNKTKIIMELWEAAIEKGYDVLESDAPAQPEGLWEHHKSKCGLADHVAEVIYYINKLLQLATVSDLKTRSFDRKALVLAALFHDISKTEGDYSQEHPQNSAEIFREVWNELKGTYKETEEDREIFRMAYWLIKNHHINFTDPDLFAKKVNNHPWFPYLLALISADLASISESWIRENQTEIRAREEQLKEGRQ